MNLKKTFAGFGLGALVASDALIALLHVDALWPLRIILFPALVLLPGYFALRAFGITKTNTVKAFLYAVTLGLFGLMIAGLGANEFTGLFVHTSRPLSFASIFIFWNILCFTLWGVATLHRKPAAQPFQVSVRAQKGMSSEPSVPEVSSATFPAPLREGQLTLLSHAAGWKQHDVIVSCLALLLPVVMALGAFRLNNGGSNIVTLFGFVCAALLLLYVVVRHKRLSEGTLLVVLFGVGLSVLLATSLRSWAITGHDIKHEYQVFTLTDQTGKWSMGGLRDAYNACLSITILPEVLSKLLHMSGLYVFKFLFEVIFALCPLIVFTILRRFTTTFNALIGAILFIAYPTFITDAAMLTRQETAYMFFGLAMLTWFDNDETFHKHWKLLFIVLSGGVIMSHYSTSYTFAAVLLLTYFARVLFVPKHAFSAAHKKLSPIMLVLIVLGTFFWYAQLTDTSGGLFATVKSSIANIATTFSADNKSSDTSAALLFSASQSQTSIFNSYVSSVQSNSSAAGQAAAGNYPISLAGDQLPYTALGKAINASGLDAGSLQDSLHSLYAKLLQVLALGGVILVGIEVLRKRSSKFSPDFFALCAASIVFLGALVVLPSISQDYGILRAFQQCMIFLLVPMILFVELLLKKLRTRWRAMLMGALALGAFVLFTPVSSNLIGGVDPSLNANSYGFYYGYYYTTGGELDGYAWLSANVPKSADVRAANYHTADMQNPFFPFTQTGILPEQTKPSSYVFLDQTQTQGQKLYQEFNGNALVTTFPLAYYQNNKDLIYANPTAEIYR
ncbi:MAG TPA: DUF2206 domain-containing protein [Candidatus Saccharimonadales bacterium]